MNEFDEEFGFIPPELMHKCETFVRAFHKTRGSGSSFVAASMMFSSESHVLNGLSRYSAGIFTIVRFVIVVSVLLMVLAIFIRWWWPLLLLIPLGAAAIILYRLSKAALIRQRAIILAVEALAIDFAGWGEFFPEARSTAQAMSARDAGEWPKLIDLYLPLEHRSDDRFIRMFRPSESVFLQRIVDITGG